MTKEKVTLTLEAGTLAALRALVGRRSLSAAVDAAVAERGGAARAWYDVVSSSLSSFPAAWSKPVRRPSG